MPRAPKDETPDQREARLTRQRRYEARKREADPAAYAAKAAAATKAYRERNPEKTKAATKKHRMANKPRFNELRRNWRSNNLVRALWLEAKSRAKARKVEFSITLEDIPPVGERCPLLGHPFPPPDVRRTPFSPSLDRKNPALGYVPGNVWVVGYRANLLKNDGTAEEHEQIARAMREQGVP